MPQPIPPHAILPGRTSLLLRFDHGYVASYTDVHGRPFVRILSLDGHLIQAVENLCESFPRAVFRALASSVLQVIGTAHLTELPGRGFLAAFPGGDVQVWADCAVFSDKDGTHIDVALPDEFEADLKEGIDRMLGFFAQFNPESVAYRAD